MTAKVTVVLKKVKGALTVPSTVLGEANSDGSYTLQVVDAQGQIAQRLVHIGIDNNVSAQVLDGLASGERVVAGDMSKTTTAQSNMRPPPPMGF
jgi:macrolide-specific efflux system membrane fusion protein